MKMRVQTQALKPGDIVGSGETVTAVYDSLACARGKLCVVLHRTIRDKNGQPLGSRDRTAQWGKYTKIGIQRD